VPRLLTHRPAIRVFGAADGKVRQGMFLSTGAVAHGTRQCQASFNDRGVHGNFAAFATLARAVAQAVLRPPDPLDRNRIDRPTGIDCRIDGRTLCTGPQLSVLATTLNRLVMGAQPFWGGAKGAIRASSFPYPLPRPILRWTFSAIAGGEDRTPPPGARSMSGSSGEIVCSDEFVIDGEFFSPPASGVVRFETGRDFTYILA
jgi:hypothetical protein